MKFAAKLAENLNAIDGKLGAALWLSLHTSVPVNQAQHEVVDHNYSRVRAPRTASHWAVSDGLVTNAIGYNFDQFAEFGGDVAYVGLGAEPVGAGALLVVFPIINPFRHAPGQRLHIRKGLLEVDLERLVAFIAMVSAQEMAVDPEAAAAELGDALGRLERKH